MICDDVRKYDYTYLDGEFDRRERAEFEAHITVCAPCRGHVEAAASFRDGLRRHLRCDEAPTHLRARICAGLDASDVGDGLPRWVIPVAMAAGLSLVVVGWQWSVTNADGLAGTPVARAGGLGTAMIRGAIVGSPGSAAALSAAALSASAAPIRTVKTPTLVAGTMKIGVRGSDPKRTAQHRPAMRVTRSLRDNMEYCESERRAGAGVRLVDHIETTEVLGGGVGNEFLAQDGNYGAIRTRANLRALVGSHMQPVPPEVAGSARVQDWLRRAAPGHSSVPIAEGAGVRLLGARLGHLGSRRVVTFRYVAFDKPVTVVRYLPVLGRGLFDDRPEPAADQQPEPSGAVRDMVAGYSVVHTVKGGEIMSVVSELEHQALMGIIQPPSFL